MKGFNEVSHCVYQENVEGDRAPSPGVGLQSLSPHHVGARLWSVD